MSITTNTLPVLDLPRWRPIAAGPSVALSPGGLVANSVLASDARSRDYANPKVWCFAQSATIYYYYNTVLDA